MIKFVSRTHTGEQEDIDFIALNNLTHVTAHLPAGIVSAGAVAMRFKTRTWVFEGNEDPEEAWLYDFSTDFVEISLVDTESAIVLPDEIGRSSGFIPLLVDGAGTVVDLGASEFEIYYAIKTDISK